MRLEIHRKNGSHITANKEVRETGSIHEHTLWKIILRVLNSGFDFMDVIPYSFGAWSWFALSNK